MSGSDARSIETSGAEPTAPRLSVFVSYSREDSAFADELVAGLKFDGRFDVLIDTEAISFGEDWRRRLSALILEADAVVFVVSPASARSETCRWEVEEAERLSKRITPALWRDVGDAPPPEGIARLNYVRFDGGRSFMAGLVALVEALRIETDWLREHTRLLKLAQAWDAIGRSEFRLLGGDDVAAAKAWAASQPPEAPSPTALHSEFIRASEAAETAALKSERARAQQLQSALTEAEAAAAEADEARRAQATSSRRVIQRTLGGLLAATAAAGVALYLKVQADSARDEAEELSTFLAEQIAYSERMERSAFAARAQFEQVLAAVVADTLGDGAGADPEAGREAAKLLLDLIVAARIGDETTYRNMLDRPIYDVETDGVSIGFQYDLSKIDPATLREDWGAFLSLEKLERLEAALGAKGARAREAVERLQDVEISLETAYAVFVLRSLPRSVRALRRAAPEIDAAPSGCLVAAISYFDEHRRLNPPGSVGTVSALRRIAAERRYADIPELLRRPPPASFALSQQPGPAAYRRWLRVAEAATCQASLRPS
ncbi:MAG: TIR domain-containing protein [Pseudomonadota bacterium]